MRNYNSIYCILIFAFLFISCSEDDETDSSIVGEWRLSEYNITIPTDLDNDGILSNNLLDEATCENMELLIFEANGTFSSSMTYNPSVNISLLNGTTADYLIDVDCDLDGTIGLSGSYTQNGNSVSLLENEATINGNELSIIFGNAVAIYNEDFTSILETKDLTLIYTKK